MAKNKSNKKQKIDQPKISSVNPNIEKGKQKFILNFNS